MAENNNSAQTTQTGNSFVRMVLNTTKCPKCGYPQFCPCESCQKYNPTDYKPWIWIDGELIKCSNCGHTMHEDMWLEETEKQFPAVFTQNGNFTQKEEE